MLFNRHIHVFCFHRKNNSRNTSLIFNPSITSNKLHLFVSFKNTQLSCNYTCITEQVIAVRFRSIFQKDGKSARNRFSIWLPKTMGKPKWGEDSKGSQLAKTGLMKYYVLCDMTVSLLNCIHLNCFLPKYIKILWIFPKLSITTQEVKRIIIFSKKLTPYLKVHSFAIIIRTKHSMCKKLLLDSRIIKQFSL